MLGVLFEIGARKLVIEENSQLVLEESERKRIEAAQKKRHEEVLDDIRQGEEHAHMQLLLIKLGKGLGYDVVVAANDRGKSFRGEKFSFHCLCGLPELVVNTEVATTIGLIDVLWFEKGTNHVACGFEVEKSTSIYSGLLRLADLALALPDHSIKVFLVAPPDRDPEFVTHLHRPPLIS